jgi:hypothetical protein
MIDMTQQASSDLASAEQQLAQLASAALDADFFPASQLEGLMETVDALKYQMH